MATKTYYEPKEEAVPWLVGIDMQKFICGYGANFIGSNYVSCVAIGCQLQWGYTNTKTKIILPISIEKLYVFFASHRSGDMIPDQVSVYVDDGIASLKTVAETGTDYYLIIGG